MHMFKNYKVHHITCLFWSFFYQCKSVVWTSWIRNLSGFFLCEKYLQKNSCSSPGHLTSISCYMECGRPFAALIFTEWVVEIKWDRQGTLSQLSGGRELLFCKFLHTSRGILDAMREQSWLPSFSQPTPSFSCRRSERPGRAPLRRLPSTAAVESSAGSSLGLVWWPQNTGMVAEIHWQTEWLKLGKFRVLF